MRVSCKSGDFDPLIRPQTANSVYSSAVVVNKSQYLNIGFSLTADVECLEFVYI